MFLSKKHCKNRKKMLLRTQMLIAMVTLRKRKTPTKGGNCDSFAEEINIEEMKSFGLCDSLVWYTRHYLSFD